MTGLPLINYVPPGSMSAMLLQFQRGPQNFICYPSARVNDNLSTSGFRERVTEAIDLMITFDMGALRIGDDFQAWAAFDTYALSGGQFAFAPSAGGGYFNCVSDDTDLQSTRKGAGVYAGKRVWRIVPDGQRPMDHGVVMAMFYQILSPLAVTTASLPDGATGSGYFQTLAASGGSGYVWAIVSASNSLPPGLVMSSAGVISGTPTTSGDYNFIVQASAGGYSAFATLGITIP